MYQIGDKIIIVRDGTIEVEIIGINFQKKEYKTIDKDDNIIYVSFHDHIEFLH